jgi:hypothetical protein
MKEISVTRLCSECDHKAELKGAWTEIAKKLPHRSVQSVYRHGLRQLHPFKRGAWSDEVSGFESIVTRRCSACFALGGVLNTVVNLLVCVPPPPKKTGMRAAGRNGGSNG